VITGFVHAYLLRPTWLIFVGVGATSVVINSGIFLSDPSLEGLVIGSIVVIIQTVIIGLGIMGGEKLTELSEQRRRTVLELESALAENAALQSRVVAQARESGVADERERMAREIHDTIAQGLIGVITQLEAGSSVVDDPAEVQRRIDNAGRLARESLQEARRAVEALMPASLEHRGLPEALEDVVGRWSEMNHIPAEMTVTGAVQSLHPEVEVTLLRVAQEALSNVAKHSQASQVRVTLSYMEDVVSIDVKDDGRGFDKAASNGGFGLTTMRRRVSGLSGNLTVETHHGMGTALSATVPALTSGAVL
jgi:signal transduction histidine kinase